MNWRVLIKNASYIHCEIVDSVVSVGHEVVSKNIHRDTITQILQRVAHDWFLPCRYPPVHIIRRDKNTTTIDNPADNEALVTCRPIQINWNGQRCVVVMYAYYWQIQVGRWTRWRECNGARPVWRWISARWCELWTVGPTSSIMILRTAKGIGTFFEQMLKA